MSMGAAIDSLTVGGALLDRARSEGGRVTFHLDDWTEELSVDRLVDEGLRLAAVLVARGVEPGDRVGVLGPNRPEWIRSAFAAWTAGAAIVPLPNPARILDRDAFARRIHRLQEVAGCRAVLVDPALADVVSGSGAIAWDETGSGSETASELPPGDSVAAIQFTSGTIALPKGVMLTHAAVLSHVRSSIPHHRITPDDRFLSWLPLFHDWGLFGFLRFVLAGAEVHLLPTDRFARDPGEWFRVAGKVGATILEGPPSAWAVALRTMARDPAGMDLSKVRRCTLSAEAMDPVLVDRLGEQGAAIGLGSGVVGSAYGLAEATLGVTATGPDRELRIDEVDAMALARGSAEPRGPGRTKRIVSCGVPYPSVEVRIAADSRPLPDRTVGEIQVRGPELMRGYVGSDDDDPFIDGWLRTGDLGYLADGELYFTGRSKDVIVVLGQNYAPEDLEWAANEVPGVRAGRSVAFSSPGQEGRATLVVEPSRGTEPAAIPGAVREAAHRSVGTLPLEVLVVRPGTVQKTTSGKLRRAAAREALVQDQLSILSRG
jgi:fatty-acyl-CoA synthase